MSVHELWKKLVCELNDRGVSLLSNYELEYAEEFVFHDALI